MEIAVVGYLNVYSSMGEWVAETLEFLGHSVTRVDRKEVAGLGENFDLYFIVDCSEDFGQSIPINKVKKVGWVLDTQMPGGLERSLNIARKCDYVVSSNKEQGMDVLKAHGVDSILVPITYNDLNIKKMKKMLDVSMIGHANSPERIRLWEMLRKYNGYHGTVGNKEDFINFMAMSKIIVNQPTEPFDNILNNRFFEALGYNCLLLQKRLKTTLIEDLGFKAGEDFLYWNELDELPSMIDTILKDYERYAEIRSRGHRKALKYALSKQLGKILEHINEN